jgi:hypothetical protein
MEADEWQVNQGEYQHAAMFLWSLVYGGLT